MIESYLPSGEPVLLTDTDDCLGDRRAVVIRSSLPVTESPPWHPMQFIRYESEELDGKVVISQEVHSYDHSANFHVTHVYDDEGVAYVEYVGYPSGKVPMRYFGDGFAPWGLVKRGMLTLHASSVYFGDEIFIFLGGHDSGKSTAAAISVAMEGAVLLSDDQLFLSFSSDSEVQVIPAFWDEATEHRTRLTARKTHVLILDSGMIDEVAGDEIQLGVDMLLMQFVVGAYCSPAAFDAAQHLIGMLVAEASIYQPGPLPSPEEIIRILRLRRDKRGSSK